MMTAITIHATPPISVCAALGFTVVHQVFYESQIYNALFVNNKDYSIFSHANGNLIELLKVDK
jgi:hypothetical protein